MTRIEICTDKFSAFGTSRSSANRSATATI